jgi:hypothetical protein
MQIDGTQVEIALLGLFILRLDYKDNHDVCRLHYLQGTGNFPGKAAVGHTPISKRIRGSQSARGMPVPKPGALTLMAL